MTIAHKLTLTVSAALFVACGDDQNPDNETVERAVEPGRYEVTAENVVLRPKDGSYAIGNLRQAATMDVHEVNGNGWAWGFAYGEVNRCVWAQFHGENKQSGEFATNFDGPIEAHKDQCGPPKELPQGEWTNGEINAKADDGTLTHINGCASPHYWDNWDHAAHTGVGQPRGSLTPEQDVFWRYVTPDGKGVMARLGLGEWYFISRDCFDALP